MVRDILEAARALCAIISAAVIVGFGVALTVLTFIGVYKFGITLLVV